MPIVVPGKDYTQSWNALADVFGNYAQTREDAYQRQRQETLDAQRLAAHEQSMINAKLLGNKRQFELGQLQSAENLVTDDLDELAALKYAAEGGGQVRSNRPGYGVDQAKNQLAYAQAARKNLLQKAGYIQTQILQNEQAQRQALAAGDTRAVRELQIKKLELETEGKRLQNQNRTLEASDLSTVAGQNFRPVDRASVPRGGRVARIPGVSDQSQQTLWKNQYNQAINRLSAGDPKKYSPTQRAELAANIGLADVASGKRNWATSLDKSGYTVAQTNNLADTFAPQFETQFDDSDEVSKREAEKMASYALAAAKQIFNNPNIPLPPGTTALDLYNQILNQRDLYATDEGWLGNDNYEPITEVATIIENWQNLNSAERPQGNNQSKMPPPEVLDRLFAEALESNPNLTREEFNARISAQLGQ